MGLNSDILENVRRLREEEEAEAETRVLPEPVSTHARSRNELRPATFIDVIGQDTAVHLLEKVVHACQRNHRRLDHILLVGPSGCGKSMLSHVIANELGVAVFEAEAPVSMDMLLDLREVMQDGDILRIEEIHQQAIMERRGKSASTQPEVMYELMEDFVLTTGSAKLDYPEITLIGTTTDEGMLPDPFVNRFPLRPRLHAYTEADMRLLAKSNAQRLKLTLSRTAEEAFAKASRNNPRAMNNLLRNAALLADHGNVDLDLARTVIHDLNGLTDDGLTADMQAMLSFLYTRGRRQNAAGDVTYQASVNSIATGIGKSRDSKAIALRVEPFLIEKGYVQVGHGGRLLTDEGVKRARQLTGGTP